MQRLGDVRLRRPFAFAGDLPCGAAERVEQKALHAVVGELDRARAERQARVLLGRAGGEVDRVGHLLGRQPLHRGAGEMHVQRVRPVAVVDLRRQLVPSRLHDGPQQVLQIELVGHEIRG